MLMTMMMMLLNKFITSMYTMRIKCHHFIYEMSPACLSEWVEVVVNEFEGNEKDVVD